MLITNGRVVTFGKANEIIENGAVRIEGRLITDVGYTAAIVGRLSGGRGRGRRRAACHARQYLRAHPLLRRFFPWNGDPWRAPRDFPEILAKLWWRLDRALLEEDVKYSALVCLVDAIKHGTTTLIDHHASPNAMDGSLDVIAEAVNKAGLRASLCYEVTDRDGPDEAQAGIDENVRFPERAARHGQPLLAASFGLHASLTLSEETLADCVAAQPRGWTPGFTSTLPKDLGPGGQPAKERQAGGRAPRRCRDPGTQEHPGALRARRCLGDGDPARHGHVGHPPATIQHEQCRGRGPGGDDAARWDQGGHGQRWIFQQHVGRVENGLPGAQAVAWRSAPRMGGYDVMQMAVANNAALARVFWPERHWVRFRRAQTPT